MPVVRACEHALACMYSIRNTLGIISIIISIVITTTNYNYC